ncbi:MAG: dienelactone hydrolase family protein [Candidatus Bathyarchaeia archaeon]|jgi:carboxymethylenebutenolidase
MEFSSRTITVKCFDGTDMIAYIATPKTGGRQPAIIIVHEAWGLNEQIKGVANRYAAQGFVSIAPHLFSRQKDLLTEQAIEKAMMYIWQIPPEKRSDPNAIQSLMKNLPENDQKVVNYFFTGRENAEKTMAEDLLCCINYVKSIETVEPESLGITGFCLGGGLSYQLTTMYPFKAAAPFYGANPKPLETVAKIKGPIFGIYAGEDQRITNGIPALVESMIRYKKTFQMKIYQGTQHAFFNETRPTYNKAAAEDAWTMTLAFFNMYLKATQ